MDAPVNETKNRVTHLRTRFARRKRNLPLSQPRPLHCRRRLALSRRGGVVGLAGAWGSKEGVNQRALAVLPK